MPLLKSYPSTFKLSWIMMDFLRTASIAIFRSSIFLKEMDSKIFKDDSKPEFKDLDLKPEKVVIKLNFIDRQ